MQIFSRRVHEGLVIGEETHITVLEIDEKQQSVQLEIRSFGDGGDRQVVTLSLVSEENSRGPENGHQAFALSAAER